MKGNVTAFSLICSNGMLTYKNVHLFILTCFTDIRKKHLIFKNIKVKKIIQKHIKTFYNINTSV